MTTVTRATLARFEATTEVVEHVLLQLPLRDIITVQRLNKTWQDVVLGSPYLQKALFQMPTQKIQLSLVEVNNASPFPCTSNYNCNSRWAQLPPHDPNGVTRWAIDISDQKEYRIVINPLVGVETPGSRDYFCHDRKRGIRDVFTSNSCRRLGASWKNMLFSQPPLKEVFIRHGEAAHWHSVKAKERSNGLTLGDVRESKLAFRAPVRSIWGEDGFSRGLSVDASAFDIITKLGLEPAEEEEEDDDDDDVIVLG